MSMTASSRGRCGTAAYPIAESLSKELTEADLVQVKEISKESGINSDTLRTILEAYATMGYAAVPHLPLELAVIDITSK